MKKNCKSKKHHNTDKIQIPRGVVIQAAELSLLRPTTYYPPTQSSGARPPEWLEPPLNLRLGGRNSKSCGMGRR